MRRSRSVFLALLAASVTCERASAQERLWDWWGQTGDWVLDDAFGAFVTRAGDVDRDGVEDALVGAPNEEPAGVWSVVGAVYLFSGGTGELLRKHVGPNDRSSFGLEASAGQDLDGDGVPDYVVSAAYADMTAEYSAEGAVYAYSGASGELLYSLAGAHPCSGFGTSSSFVADRDGDGVAELAISSPAYTAATGPARVGRIDVVSGATGVLLHRFEGAVQDEGLSTVVELGDTTGDGTPELGLGAMYSSITAPGRFDVLDGRSFSVLHSLEGESLRDWFGSRAASLGDVDADGVRDFVVAAPLHSVMNEEGRVYVYSGATATLLFQYDGVLERERFGSFLPSDGDVDVNGDGWADITVGSGLRRGGYGAVQAWSGRTGELLHQYRGSFERGAVGGPVSSMGDVDGDGLDDLLIGAFNNTTDWTGGHAYVDTGNDLFLQANETVLREGDVVHLNVRGGAPGAIALIVLVGIDHEPLFMPVLAAPLDDEGILRVSTTVPAMLAGRSFTLRGFAVAASGHGVIDSSTEVVRIR